MSRKTVLFLLIVFIAALALPRLCSLSADVSNPRSAPAKAQKVVEAQGFTDPEYVGVDLISCPTQGHKFRATNSNGARVLVIACPKNGALSWAPAYYLIFP